MKLSKSAEIVQKALFEKGLTFEVLELAASTRTANDAASAIGCQVGQIVKSLLFCTFVVFFFWSQVRVKGHESDGHRDGPRKIK